MSDLAHRPVMMAEVLEALQPRAGGRYADGTLGGAGHAAAILRASAPTGWLYGCDRDGVAVAAAHARLAEFAGRFELRQESFARLAEWIPPVSCDGVLLDLGVNSMQLAEASRGFSFQREGPLDMRMDQRQALTAAELIKRATVDELTKMFWELGDEPEGRRFAQAIVQARERRPLATTKALADVIEQVSRRRGRKTHPATRVFQSLRIAVNDELTALQQGLAAALQILKPGGRLAVISFHSLEDRIVKTFGRARARDYAFSGGLDVPELREPRVPELKLITREAGKPSPVETADNPRSRSARLRVMQKV